MTSRALVASAGVLLAVTAAACGSAEEPGRAAPSAPSQSESSSTAPSDGAAEEVVITISNFAFQVPDAVPPGAQVTVVNEDSSYHTATADDGAFDVGARQGEPVTFTAPEEPGEYAFHCTPHPNMTATLVVG